MRFRSRPHIQASIELTTCASMVDRYIATAQKWSEQDYKVSVDGTEAGVTLFRVSHVDDFRGSLSEGGGTSIFVEVDCGAGRVLRTLGGE